MSKLDPDGLLPIVLCIVVFVPVGVWMALTATSRFDRIMGLLVGVLFFGMGGSWWLYVYWKQRPNQRR